MNSEVTFLLRALDEAFDRKSWHGTNLRGSLRGLSAAEAAWRPAPGRHSIREIVVHCAYWKYAVWRRLTGATRGSFPIDGSNWFERPPSRSMTAWRAERRLLEAMHQELRKAVANVDRRVLHRRLPGSKVTRFDLIAGVAAHDLYHAGQIQLIKRLGR